MNAADMPTCPDCGEHHPSHLAAALCCDENDATTIRSSN